MPPRLISRRLQDGESLTQYGSSQPMTAGRVFRARPRSSEKDLSLLAGRLTPVAAATAVTGGAAPGSFARYTTVGKLRRAGFTVLHTPSRKLQNHVSVEYSGEWDDDVDTRFDACFTKPLGGGA